MNLEADFVNFQEDLAAGLMSEPLLANINVVLYRKLRVQSGIGLDTIWQTPRHGRSGCGIVVEMPAFRVLHPNVSGPPGSLAISCSVVEEPNTNFAPPGGTFQSAESVARLVLNSGHQWSNSGVGVMTAEREAIRETQDYGPGVVAYRVRWQVQEEAGAIPRAPAPGVAVDPVAGVGLSCALSGAQIYYTLVAPGGPAGGSFPGPGNPLAALYAQPFPAPAPGTLMRVAAYAAGMFRSSTLNYPF